MIERAAWRVGIIDDQCKAAGLGRNVFKMQGWNSVLSVFAVFIRNLGAVIECMTCDFHKTLQPRARRRAGVSIKQ